MEGMLKKGTTLKAESGSDYKVVQMLGSGGQGEVYEVKSNKKSYALKWYFKKTATNTQKSILENLIKNGSPDDVFLWMQDIITDSKDGSFGYIMPLRPKHFKSIVDMMKRRAEPSFKALCRAAFNLTKGYEKLHGKGYAYRDISFGNVFFDPDNGDVLICDNDNVSASKQASVYGTPRFMAPEIVVGKAKPSRNTDLFSLSVLLFYMFMLNHPLEGKKEYDIKALDIHAMNQLYGTNPIFIFDPNNKSNNPVAGYHDNAIIFWKLYPKRIKDLFIQSFTDGLTHPGKRVTERQWMDAFSNLLFGILHCSCGMEVFYDEDIANSGAAILCWGCQKALQTPISIVSGKSRVLLMGDTKIYSHHIKSDYDIDAIVGTVVQNPNNPNLWGLRNDGKDNWTYIKTDGTQIPVAPGKSAAITKGAKIDFGQQTGEFI
jgi:serine/threonine protein kinase